MPLTAQWPKCLMPIGERPLLEYWLETLWKSRVREVLVNLHYLPEVVQDFLNRPRFQDWVVSVKEPQLLGTAGTLRTNAEFLEIAPCCWFMLTTGVNAVLGIF